MASDASSALAPWVRNIRPRAAAMVHVEENMVVVWVSVDPDSPVRVIRLGKTSNWKNLSMASS